MQSDDEDWKLISTQKPPILTVINPVAATGLAMYQMKKYTSPGLVPHRPQTTSPHPTDSRLFLYGSTLSNEMSPADPKPRLRWTPELHERFVDAVTQLGGADSEFFLSLLSFLLPFLHFSLLLPTSPYLALQQLCEFLIVALEEMESNNFFGLAQTLLRTRRNSQSC